MSAKPLIAQAPSVNLRLPPSSRRKAIMCKALGFNWVLTCFKIYSSTAIAVPLPSQGKANVIVTFDGCLILNAMFALTQRLPCVKGADAESG